ncbi:MAG: hypothetical protein PGN13_06735 [Patulibacter minatonensis]
MSDTTQERVADPIGEPQEQHSGGDSATNPHEVARLAAADAARALVLGEDTPVPSQEAAEPEEIPLDAPELLFNRELSWMAFDDRVLQLAERERTTAAGAREVPRHLGEQPRRVLHGARRWSARPGRRRRHRARRRRPHPR